jgi:uncharacterized protein YjiK
MKIVLFLTVISTFVFFHCNEKSQPSKVQLTYIGAYAISVPEPSGLDLTHEEDGFWTVSDETSTIYKLDADGNVVKTLKIDGIDFEGITVIDDTTLAIVLEREREVVTLNTSGNEINRVKLPFEGEPNSGLEGITYNPNDGRFYILNEKNPSLLIELNDKFEVLNVDTLNLSKDVSGIYLDVENNVLWMLSDENQIIIKTDLRGNLIEKVNMSIVQPEGITIDKKGRRLYIVSDNRETLYVFEFR